jgi:hypothetical protein
MQETIKVINEKLMEMAKRQLPGLMHGQTGLCIYFYKANKLLNQPRYETVADGLLDAIYEQKHENLPNGIEYGVAGIGLGFTHLIRERFSEGNINEILEMIDIQIFKFLTSLKKQTLLNTQEKAELLYYYSVRYKDLEKGSANEYIFNNLIFNPTWQKCPSKRQKIELLDEVAEHVFILQLAYYKIMLAGKAVCSPRQYINNVKQFGCDSFMSYLCREF